MNDAAVAVIPILHPSYVLKEGLFALVPGQIAYLARIPAIVDGTWQPALDYADLGAGVNLEPTLPEIEAFLALVDDRGVSCDIENAGDHLVCVGFTRLQDEATLIVWLRDMGALPYWRSPSELARVVTLLYGVLADPEVPKVFQNGQVHDVLFLEGVGFEVANFAFDTLIAAHTSFPESPKDLEYLAMTRCGFLPWKHMTKLADVGELK